jgi:hypothetical protein
VGEGSYFRTGGTQYANRLYQLEHDVESVRLQLLATPLGFALQARK